MRIRNYTDLFAWQKAMALVESVYESTAAMPLEERYGLTAQMRRAAISIPSNIAEGQERRTDGEFLNQLSIAHGSLRELETQILLANRLALLQELPTAALLKQCQEVGKLVTGLANSIDASR